MNASEFDEKFAAGEDLTQVDNSNTPYGKNCVAVAAIGMASVPPGPLPCRPTVPSTIPMSGLRY